VATTAVVPAAFSAIMALKPSNIAVADQCRSMFTMFTFVDEPVDDENKCRQPGDCSATSPRWLGHYPPPPCCLGDSARFRCIPPPNSHYFPREIAATLHALAATWRRACFGWLAGAPAFIPAFQPPEGPQRSGADRWATGARVKALATVPSGLCVSGGERHVGGYARCLRP